ncbi:hypothetical protein C8R45DRAFT_1005862 [Mycena sanguinolenta]|nr:hypothetical protein C8R45DRAFT_1005862 [Mycena sanguinolenta]
MLFRRVEITFSSRGYILDRLMALSANASSDSVSPYTANARRMAFLTGLRPEDKKHVLLHGYPSRQNLKNDLEKHNVPSSLDEFFQGCVEKVYYRFFQALAPKRESNDWKEAPTVTVNIEIRRLKPVDNETLSAQLFITAEWIPGRWELRNQYQSLKVKEENGYGECECIYRAVLKHCVDPLDEANAEEKIDNFRSQRGTSFYIPPLSLRVDGDLPELLLRDVPHGIGVENGKIHARWEFWQPFKLNADITGGSFPFDKVTGNLTILSMEDVKEIRLKVVLKTEKNIKHLEVPLWYRTRIAANVQFRDRSGKNHNNEPTRGHNRSLISINFTAQRRWSYYIWKIVIPLDIITLVGVGAFLLIPENPTPDQRILVATYLVLVLLAQAAFTFSAQAMLPSFSGISLLDIYGFGCFLVTASQAVIFVAIPTNKWSHFGSSNIRFIVFGCTLVFMLIGHVVPGVVLRYRQGKLGLGKFKGRTVPSGKDRDVESEETEQLASSKF